MKGYDIYKKVLARSGFENGDEIVLHNAQFANVLEMINQIAADLKVGEITELSEEVSYSNEITEAICCGVAMLLSLNEGDFEKNQIFAGIYNAKRAAVLGKITHVEDTLPVAESGD